MTPYMRILRAVQRHRYRGCTPEVRERPGRMREVRFFHLGCLEGLHEAVRHASLHADQRAVLCGEIEDASNEIHDRLRKEP